MELRVRRFDGVDRSMNPVAYEPGGKEMITLAPLPAPESAAYRNAVHRTYRFGRSGGTDDRP